MRNPERWRNISLAITLAGPACILVAFAAPEGTVPDGLRGGLFALGIMCVLFGGISFLMLHQAVKRKRRLARGEGMLAHWRIPADDWRAFLALDAERNARGDRDSNDFSPRMPPTGRDVEIRVGKDAVEIEGSLHSLPRHGNPIITRAEYEDSRSGVSVIEMDLLHGGDGISAPGTSDGPRPALLRFPVPAGAAHQAQAIVAHFGQLTAGEPTFFHGPGDGSDPEDLTVCWKCGFQTHRLVESCQRCGASMVSRRWARRFGVVLVLCGLVLTVMMSFVLANLLPTLLHPGERIGDTSFNGSPGMATFVILILGGVLVFGVTALGYGIFQVVTGRRSWPVVRAMLAIVGGLYVVGIVIQSGYF